ncbi:MAG TPA: hypothetical protein VKA21_10740, partial [Candidatus Binatia bacterium]|nr:hypothetical protein [Candidatus Binatia bacterium]
MSTLTVLAPVAAALLVYLPVVRNYFYADDFILFYDLANEGPLAFVLTPYGGHLQVARNLVFLASVRLFGTEPAPYFWMVLLTHLVNVALLFHVVRLLTGRRALAATGALLFGASPLAEGALGWYSIYGQVLAATVTLVLLALWGRAAVEGRVPSPGVLALSFALAVVGSTCFGVGLGIAFALPVVFAVVFPAASRRARLAIAGLWIAIPVFYVAMHALHRLVSSRPVPGASPLAAFQHAADVLALLVQLLIHGVGGLLLGFLAPPARHPA